MQEAQSALQHARKQHPQREAEPLHTPSNLTHGVDNLYRNTPRKVDTGVLVALPVLECTLKPEEPSLGFTVYGAARRTERPQKLASDGIHPLEMDVTDDNR
ncbi:hypothetical protein FHU42_000657 [Corynebacterium glutamicum]|nr:hypothetical protein [Corynebacterium glutamicum]